MLCSVTAVSIVRLYILFNLAPSDPDTTWYFSDQVMWTGIEVNVATVCGNVVHSWCEEELSNARHSLPSILETYSEPPYLWHFQSFVTVVRCPS